VVADDGDLDDSAEFFSPPYLFKNSGVRPTITSAPSQLSYGQNFTVATPNAAQIAMVSLIRFGSVTHCINMSQRFLPLSLKHCSPANANLAPPGNYMLLLSILWRALCGSRRPLLSSRGHAIDLRIVKKKKRAIRLPACFGREPSAVGGF
jgi:hypothetical protein